MFLGFINYTKLKYMLFSHNIILHYLLARIRHISVSSWYLSAELHPKLHFIFQFLLLTPLCRSSLMELSTAMTWSDKNSVGVHIICSFVKNLDFVWLCFSKCQTWRITFLQPFGNSTWQINYSQRTTTYLDDRFINLT